MERKSKNILSLMGIAGIGYGIILTPIAYLTNTFGNTNENLLSRLIVSVILIIVGLYMFKKGKQKVIKPQKSSRFVGIIGLVWGIIFTPLVLLTNKYLNTNEDVIPTLVVSIVFIIAGVFLLVRSKKMAN